MKSLVRRLLTESLQQISTDADIIAMVQVDYCRDPKHGDYASNIAMQIAKTRQQAPRDIAQQIIDHIPAHEAIENITLAGPGFINFTLSPQAYKEAINAILTLGSAYGQSDMGASKKIHIEYVSANPTGPLHVGHGRGAAYGASLANLLATVGYQVHREYYVNDAGRQMHILATSVWLRYLAAHQQALPFPTNAYQGDYILAIAQALTDRYQQQFVRLPSEILAGLPADEPDGRDKEAYIDALIAKTQQLLGQTAYQQVLQLSVDSILSDIREDLAAFGVTYQAWFSEQSLKSSGAIQRCIDTLTQQGHTYEKEGALWFNASGFGDEKDRVLIRANGQTTYFAADVAYHLTKFERGYDHMIDIFGADHHGYVSRVKASVEALGKAPETVDVELVQFAILYRGNQRVQMSTRSGSFVTLRELRNEVGNDACRYFYVMRKASQHLDFDLELAKSSSSDNPVYYIQYAYARICQVAKQLAGKPWSWQQDQGLVHFTRLAEPQERQLMTLLSRYPDTVESAALAHEPHQIAHYLKDLANALHVYYNAHQFLVEDDTLRNARLCLIFATKQVIANGLTLLGVSAPEQM